MDQNVWYSNESCDFIIWKTALIVLGIQMNLDVRYSDGYCIWIPTLYVTYLCTEKLVVRQWFLCKDSAAHDAAGAKVGNLLGSILQKIKICNVQ